MFAHVPDGVVVVVLLLLLLLVFVLVALVAVVVCVFGMVARLQTYSRQWQGRLARFPRNLAHGVGGFQSDFCGVSCSRLLSHDVCETRVVPPPWRGTHMQYKHAPVHAQFGLSSFARTTVMVRRRAILRAFTDKVAQPGRPIANLFVLWQFFYQSYGDFENGTA